MKKIILVSAVSAILGMLVGVLASSYVVSRNSTAQSLGFLILAYEHLEKREFDDAIALFHRALAYTPDRYESHSGLGRAYEGLGLLDFALKEYKLAVDLTSPADKAELSEKVMLLSRIGDIYSQQRAYEKALTTYQEAIRLEPKWPDSYLGLGMTYYKMKNVEGARRNLKEFLRLEIREKRVEQRNLAEKLLGELERVHLSR